MINSRSSIRVQASSLLQQQTPRRITLYFILLAAIMCGAMLLAIQVRLGFAVERSNPDAAPTIQTDFDSPVTGRGWYMPEGGSTWTSATQSTLIYPQIENPEWYEIKFRAMALTNAIENSVQLSINGTEIPLSHSRDDESWSIYQGVLNKQFLEEIHQNENNNMLLTFSINGITSPEAIGINSDNRLLGLRFDWLEFAPVLPPAVQSVWLFGLLITAAGGGARFTLQVRRSRPNWEITRLIFFTLVLTTLMTGILVGLLIPGISTIQVIAFIGISILIAGMVIIWAPTPVVYGKPQTLISHLRNLWANRFLLALWTRYNITSRYSQAFLGIFWIILQPLALSLILAFVFSQILRAPSPEGIPHIAFLLAAMIPWTFFNQAIMLSATSLIASGSLLQKVFFPREIIVIVKLFEALIDAGFMFAAMLVINFFVGVYPNVSFIYLPILIIIQLLLTLGFMLFISYLSLMIRDVPQLVQIILRFMFYLTPILYESSAIPAQFSILNLLNPLSPLIDGYRAVILYNSAPNWVSLYYPVVLSGVLLYTGYMFFKKNEKRLADYL